MTSKASDCIRNLNFFQLNISGDLEAFYTPLSEVHEGEYKRFSVLKRGGAATWPDSSLVSEVAVLLAVITSLYFCGVMSLQAWSIIAVAVSFTWFHIALALRMCFFPLFFRGFQWGPVKVGWEGIIPSKASKMARKSCDLIIDRLIMVDRILDRISGSGVSRHLIRLGISNKIETKIMDRLKARMFNGFPVAVSDLLLRKHEGISERICSRFVSEMVSKLKDRSVFNVADLIIDEFSHRKDVLVNLFTRVGSKELSLIERSGIFMGLFCGIAQLAVYHVYLLDSTQTNTYLLFSATGLVIGLVTNWIALFVIFNPIEPIVLFKSSIKIHSLFLRRQEEVSRVYSKIVTESVLNVDQVISHLKQRNNWHQIVDLFNSILKDEIKNRLRATIPFVPSNRIEKLANDVFTESLTVLAENADLLTTVIVPFVETQIQLENQLYVALVNLSYTEFDGILHPVFKEDEGTLILLGGILGALVGALQVFLFNL